MLVCALGCYFFLLGEDLNVPLSNCAFSPNARGRQDPIQSERRDEGEGEFFAREIQICRATNQYLWRFDLSRHTFAVHKRARSRGFVG